MHRDTLALNLILDLYGQVVTSQEALVNERKMNEATERGRMAAMEDIAKEKKAT
jgi:hypothetical protein